MFVKRAFALAAAIILPASIVSMPIYSKASANVSVTVSNITASAGSDVSISIDISSNSQLAAADLSLKYDNTKLTLKRSSAGIATVGGTISINNIFKVEGNFTTIKASFMCEDGITASGAMVIITFTVKTGWTGSTPLELTIGDFVDNEFNNIPYSITNGSINVPSIPATPILAASPTSATNNTVTVTITYPEDAVSIEYKVDSAAWGLYTAPVILTANCNVYARCSNTVGTYSNIGSIAVTNIYRLLSRSGSASVINPGNHYIYGLETGMSKTVFENSFVQLSGNGKLVYLPDSNTLGTGTKVEIVDNSTNEVEATYTILIYGDVNSDGNIDSIDAGLVVDVENYIVKWDLTSDAVLKKAADLNGDGNVDSIDAGIMVDIENYIVNINQSTGERLFL